MGLYRALICVSALLLYCHDVYALLSRKDSALMNKGLHSLKKNIRLSYTSTSALVDMPKQQLDENSAVVVGSGPVGLATAIMLARQGLKNIAVFDQLPKPAEPNDLSYWGTFQSERSYNIGITGRGYLVLKELDCWEDVQPHTAEIYGGLTWMPGTPLDKPNFSKQIRRHPTRCLERDRLTGALLQVIRKKYADTITVQFDSKCEDVQWHNPGTKDEYCTVSIISPQSGAGQGEKTALVVNTPFLVGADGSNSVVRDKLVLQDKSVKTRKYEEINEYVYRTVPILFPRRNDICPEGKELTYSARVKEGISLETLPTAEGIHLGVFLYKPDCEIIKNITTTEDAKQFVRNFFPMVYDGIAEEGFSKLASSRDSRFQRFQYVYPKLHYGRSTCLLGDSIHTVKPYFGLGVNSGLEDVGVLGKSLRANRDRSVALKKYSNERAKEAKALVRISQRMDRGFVYFILPLIIDRLFHQAFPWLFESTTISCMQDERKKFTQTLRRKMVDRIVQLAMVSSFCFAVCKFIDVLLRGLLFPRLRWLFNAFV